MTAYAKLIKAGLLIAVVLAIFYVGMRFERSGWLEADNDRLKTDNAVIIGRAVDNAAKVEENNESVRNIASGVQNEIADVDRYKPSAGGMRLPAPVCPSVAGGAKTPSAQRIDGAAASPELLPDEVGRALLEFERSQRAFEQSQREFEQGTGELAKQADTMTAKMRGMQEFANKHGFYGKPTDAP